MGTRYTNRVDFVYRLLYIRIHIRSNTWGPLPWGPGSPWTPRGPVIDLDPQIVLNIKILCENKRINNSFENSSLVVTSQNIFLNLPKNFSSTQNHFIFSYTQNFFEYFDMYFLMNIV